MVKIKTWAPGCFAGGGTSRGDGDDVPWLGAVLCPKVWRCFVSWCYCREGSWDEFRSENVGSLYRISLVVLLSGVDNLPFFEGLIKTFSNQFETVRVE